MITRPPRRTGTHPVALAPLLVLATLFALLLAGCSTPADKAMDAAAAKLQQEYAQQPGVSAVNVDSSLPNEAIWGRQWRATISFAPGTTPSEQAALIVRFFESAAAHGLPTQQTTSGEFLGASFTLDGDRELRIGTAVDATIGEVTDALLNRHGVNVSIDRPDAPPSSTGTSGTARLTALFRRKIPTNDAAGVARAAADTLATFARPRSFTTTVLVSSKDFTVASGHVPSSTETAFLTTTMPAWLKAHPVSRFSLPLGDDDTFWLQTPTAEPDAVRALVTAARAAGIDAAVTATVTGTARPYLTIPRG